MARAFVTPAIRKGCIVVADAELLNAIRDSLPPGATVNGFLANVAGIDASDFVLVEADEGERHSTVTVRFAPGQGVG